MSHHGRRTTTDDFLNEGIVRNQDEYAQERKWSVVIRVIRGSEPMELT